MHIKLHMYINYIYIYIHTYIYKNFPFAFSLRNSQRITFADSRRSANNSRRIFVRRPSLYLYFHQQTTNVNVRERGERRLLNSRETEPNGKYWKWNVFA